MADSGIEIADEPSTSTNNGNNDNGNGGGETDIAEASSCSSSSYSITVSNGPRGHLARIKCVALFPVSPETIYAVLTNPDNTGVFRDVLDSTRKVLSEEDAEDESGDRTVIIPRRRRRRRVVEVEQTGRVRLPFGEVRFKTRLRVTEDSTEAPQKWTTRFELLGSDVLSTFDGTWTLEPKKREEGEGEGEDDDDGKNKSTTATTTVATLLQDVTPRGVPRFLKFVPFVGGGVKRACARAVRRMVEDLAAVADAVAAKEKEKEREGKGASSGGAKKEEEEERSSRSGGGWAVEEVLRECHERAAREKEKEKEKEKEGEEKGEAVAAAAAVGS